MGFEVTIPPAPAEDADLDAVFQALVAGIPGLDGTEVRPRWQPVLPKQPEPGANWCAIGVMSATPDGYAYITHVNGPLITDPSADLMIRHERLEVLASFYGPNAKANAGLLRDGLQIEQNRYGIEAVDIAFTETGPMRRTAPDFINQQWVRRIDMMVSFRRKISRVYAVNNILSATVKLIDDSGHVDDTITAPPPPPVQPALPPP